MSVSNADVEMVSPLVAFCFRYGFIRSSFHDYLQTNQGTLCEPINIDVSLVVIDMLWEKFPIIDQIRN
jgi:hypothetical protein